MPEKKETVKGYKVFDKDWRCFDFQYEVGKTYKHKGELRMCYAGFHFCRELQACFKYKLFDPANKVAEVEALGEVVEGDGKCVTNEIRIVREMYWDEVLRLCNTGKNNTGRGNSGNSNSGHYNSGNSNSGHYNSGNGNSGNDNSGDWNSGNGNSGHYNSGNGNTGDWNSGNGNSGNDNSGDWNFGNGNSCNRNSGNWNSGNYNSGDWNSGNYNSGRWNSGSHNSGYLNTDRPPLRMFNKPILGDVEPDFPTFFYCVHLNVFVNFEDMSEQEKIEHPEYKVLYGYLKSVSYKEAWKKAFEEARKKDDWEKEKAKLLALPNFDFKVFEEITGISEEDIMG